MEKAHCAVIDENGEVISDPDVEIDHSAISVARIRALNAEQAGTENPEIANVYKQYGKNSGGAKRLVLDAGTKSEFVRQ